MHVLEAELTSSCHGFLAEGEKRLKKLEKALGREGIEFRPESYKWSCVQVGALVFKAVHDAHPQPAMCTLCCAAGAGGVIACMHRTYHPVSLPDCRQTQTMPHVVKPQGMTYLICMHAHLLHPYALPAPRPPVGPAVARRPPPVPPAASSAWLRRLAGQLPPRVQGAAGGRWMLHCCCCIAAVASQLLHCCCLHRSCCTAPAAAAAAFYSHLRRRLLLRVLLRLS